MKIGDVVIVLYEKKSYNIIVGKGQTSSSWIVYAGSSGIRTIPTLELKVVFSAKEEYGFLQ